MDPNRKLNVFGIDPGYAGCPSLRIEEVNRSEETAAWTFSKDSDSESVSRRRCSKCVVNPNQRSIPRLEPPSQPVDP